MSGDELQPFRGMALGLHNHVADDECGDECSFYPALDVIEGEIVDPGSPLYRKFFPNYAEFARLGFL